MKFAALLVAFATAVSAQVTVSFDNVYDDPNGSLTTVACSTGTNGLITRGFTTFGSLPSFPRIGGVPAISGFNDADCGTCWNLTFTSGGVSRSVQVLGIDVAVTNFNIAEAAMNILTNNQAEQLGRVPVTFSQVNASFCGL